MIKASKFIIFLLLFVDIILLGYVLIGNSNIQVLNPQGLIAAKQRDVIVATVVIMSAVVIPVVILIFFVAWKYRAGNLKAKYSPDWIQNKKSEFLWWIIPGIIVFILAIITWKSTHELDPYRTIESDKKPVTIQVVALRWKWLFIYPQENIATVNFIQFPVNTPVNFELTADAPMSSFWIPQLGGQIYAMTGMGTKLHLIANKTGEFAGSSAEINGEGFSGMIFTAKASSQADFDSWVQKIKESSNTLGLPEYNNLVKPSKNNPVTFYASPEKDLYNRIIMKYMAPQMMGSEEKMPTVQGMEH